MLAPFVGVLLILQGILGPIFGHALDGDYHDRIRQKPHRSSDSLAENRSRRKNMTLISSYASGGQGLVALSGQLTGLAES